MDLSKLSNKELLESTKALVRKERQLKQQLELSLRGLKLLKDLPEIEERIDDDDVTLDDIDEVRAVLGRGAWV